MSDKMRWRYGDTNPVVAAVDSATVIEVGDLVWQDTDDAKPCSTCKFPSKGWEANNPQVTLQELFAANFLGVAMQGSRSWGSIRDTTPIRVATTGVFEFDVLVGDCFELGDPIGIGCYDNSGYCGPQNQQVERVTNPKLAIGRVAKFEHAPSTTVLVDIQSKVMEPCW